MGGGRELKRKCTFATCTLNQRRYSTHMTNATRSVPEIRYDLNGNSHLLDLDSQEALLTLGLKWADRNAELAAEVFDLIPYEVREELDIDKGWSCLTPNYAEAQ